MAPCLQDTRYIQKSLNLSLYGRVSHEIQHPQDISAIHHLFCSTADRYYIDKAEAYVPLWYNYHIGITMLAWYSDRCRIDIDLMQFCGLDDGILLPKQRRAFDAG